MRLVIQVVQKFAQVIDHAISLLVNVYMDGDQLSVFQVRTVILMLLVIAFFKSCNILSNIKNHTQYFVKQNRESTKGYSR